MGMNMEYGSNIV